jgi:hypothetical protein
MARFNPQGSFVVGDHQLHWFVRHYGGGPLYAEKRGLSIGVRSEKGERELHIEFEFTEYFFEAPKSDAEFRKRLARCVSNALESKWKPEARGKPLKIASTELENENGA